MISRNTGLSDIDPTLTAEAEALLTKTGTEVIKRGRGFNKTGGSRTLGSNYASLA